jgi:hypothetical protein
MTTYYIYKIYCNDENVTDTYIGSTKNISTRKYYHKRACNNQTDSHHNLKVYQMIRANGGWENWDFVVIEEIKECSKVQAHIREEYHRQETKSNMNSVCCFSGVTDYNTREEYKKKYYEIELNKNKKKEQDKQYYEANINQIKIYRSIKHMCECGTQYTIYHKLRHIKSKKHQNYLANLKEVIV